MPTMEVTPIVKPSVSVPPMVKPELRKVGSGAGCAGVVPTTLTVGGDGPPEVLKAVPPVLLVSVLSVAITVLKLPDAPSWERLILELLPSVLRPTSQPTLSSVKVFFSDPVVADPTARLMTESSVFNAPAVTCKPAAPS